jgi:hypothetical protein
VTIKKSLEESALMRTTRTAESGVTKCDGSFSKLWTIRTLAVMLVAFAVILGACDQLGQPNENQQAQEDTAGQQQPQGEEGDLPNSEIARLKPGTYTLLELPPPEPVSAENGLRDVDVLDNGSMFAHPPSGAAFAIKNKRRPVSVTFTPSFVSNAPADKTDGVTFKVWSGKERLYEKNVLPDDSASAVTLDLPGATTKDVVQLSFVTGGGPSGDRNYDWALWRDVRIVVEKGKRPSASAGTTQSSSSG